MSDQPPWDPRQQQGQQHPPQQPYGQQPYPPGQPQYGQPDPNPWQGQPPDQGQPTYPMLEPYGKQQSGTASEPKQPRPPWIRQHAVLAVIVAGAIGLFAGAGIGAAAHTTTVTKVKTNTVFQTVPADTSTPTPTPTPTQTAADMLSVGQAETLQDTSSGATIGTLTVETASVTTQSADGSGNAPANGYYVVVHVKAAADSSYTNGWSVSESDFYDLVNGQHYDNGNGNAFDALTSAQANSLDANLAAGETADGWLSFDVPSRHGEIVYAPNNNGQPIAEWSY